MIPIILFSIIQLITANNVTDFISGGCIIQFEMKKNFSSICKNGKCHLFKKFSDSTGHIRFLKDCGDGDGRFIEPMLSSNVTDICVAELKFRFNSQCGLCVPNSSTCESIEYDGISMKNSIFCGGTDIVKSIPYEQDVINEMGHFGARLTDNREMRKCPYLST